MLLLPFRYFFFKLFISIKGVVTSPELRGSGRGTFDGGEKIP